MTRSASKERTTKETRISVGLDLDGATGVVTAATGLPFFDHMLDQLGRHGGFDLDVRATGDLQVDGHHTVEDVGITLGEVFREALGPEITVERTDHILAGARRCAYRITAGPTPLEAAA